jgi:hypothetical protein
MFRKVRIAILLLILLFVALNTYFDRVYSTDWDIPLRVAVFPINADGTDESERYIQSLEDDDFVALEGFFTEEAERYAVEVDPPIRFALAAPIRELPPMLEEGAGMLGVMSWSLRMRYWAWSVPENPAGVTPDIKLFLLYHDPARSPMLPHSMGLQKGLFGIVNVFAAKHMAGSNDTVTAHELLHTLGATDKYDLRTNLPQHPAGYAEPNLRPLHPQSLAELMAGRIPISRTRSDIPEFLGEVVIGPLTATEIGWTPQ